MKRLEFRPRKSFDSEVKRLSTLDKTITYELQEAIEILLEQRKLPEEFNDHELNQELVGYREFHLRDTPKGKKPDESNDVLVIYKIREDELILIGVQIGSHKRLFSKRRIYN